jgi:hypothetical protein
MKKLLLLLCIVSIGFNTVAQKKTKSVQKIVVKPNPCAKIDTFSRDGKTFYSTDFTKQVQVVKSVTSIDTTYYLFLQTTGNILVEEPTGYFVLLNTMSNGKISNETYKVSVEKNDKGLFNGDKYIYRASLKIDKLNFIEIGMHGIIGFKIYIFEGYFTEEENEQLKQQCHCLWK